MYDRKQEVFMSDGDFVQFDRKLSPDSSMILLSYGIDLGAFGYGQAGHAILKLTDTTKNLRNFTLPNTLKHLNWVDTKSIVAQIDYKSVFYGSSGRKSIIQQYSGSTNYYVSLAYQREYLQYPAAKRYDKKAT